MTEAVIVWAVQATVILTVGLLAALLLWRRAAAGHCVLVAALGALLALPLASWLAVRSGLGLLPAREVATGSLDQVAAAPVGPQHSPARASPTIASDAISSGATVTPRPAVHRDSFNEAQLVRAAAIAWLIMSGVIALRIAVGISAAARIRARSRPYENDHIAGAIRWSAEAIGIHRSIQLRRSGHVSCPVICCWGSPAIVVPNTVAPEGIDWEAVTTHELAHLKRRDHLWALVAEAVVCVLPWHPLAWAARRWVHALAEAACDEWALRSARSAATYADSLLAFAPRRRLALAPAIVSRGGLSVRVRSILSGRRGAVRAGRGMVGVTVCIAAVGIAVTAFARPRQPERPPEARPAAKDRTIQEDQLETPAIGAERVGVKLEELVAKWKESRGLDANPRMWDLAKALGDTNDPRVIPVMIGIIDADQSYNTVYGVGYFGLAKITGVKYSPFHDGEWWRRWWSANREKFAAVKDAAIPAFPKTQYAKTYTPFPADLDTYEGLTRKLLEDYSKSRPSELSLADVARALADLKDPRVIPIMIGVIDADNSYGTVYGVGYFGLGWLTKVEYSPYHDGAWWRRWWEANKAKYPGAAGIPIPELPKTEHGKRYTAMPESFETLDGKVAWLRDSLATGRSIDWTSFAEAVASHKDPRAIPFLIAIIDAERVDTTYNVGHFGLTPLTNIKFDKSHDAAWWRTWWEDNKSKYPKEVQESPLPDLRELVRQWKKGETDRRKAELDAEFAGFPVEKIAIEGNPRKTYFLIGPGATDKQPPAGWKLLLILPGGAGGEEFHAYCRNIHKSALPPGYIAAQLVAPVWKNHENRTVWPTSKLNPDGAEFTTEDFIKAVVADASGRVKVDASRVYALAWSSSGPALYCDALQTSPLKGYFIAMSVFRPQWMGDVAGAKGKPYYILHSPQDKMIPIGPHARQAEADLGAAGAVITVTEYAGGHGWTEDPFGHIRRGVEWLEAKTAK